MHIEKNVFDNIIDTIVGLEGKTKDSHEARQGWMEQGIHQEMWLDGGESSSRREKFRCAPYTVSNAQWGLEIKENLLRGSKGPRSLAGLELELFILLTT